MLRSFRSTTEQGTALFLNPLAGSTASTGHCNYNGRGRDRALDCTKGILILLMVLYHWVNLSWGAIGWLNNHLRFVTTGFIFVSGWTISRLHIYRGVALSHSDYRRLTLRGAYIFACYIFLNLTIACVGWRGAHGPSNWVNYWRELFGIFVSGNSAVMSFQVLLPISWLLVLSGRGLRLGSYTRTPLLCLVLGSAALSQLFEGTYSRNINLLSFGLLGLLIGKYNLASEYNKKLGFFIGGGLICYVSALQTVGPTYLVQFVTTPMLVACLYAISKLLLNCVWAESLLALLGRHPLTAYVAHIVALQCMIAAIGHRRSEPIVAAFVALYTAVVVVVAIWFTERLSPRRRLSHVA
jgi:fucose 4-O-acetylase-like acetyltransferase